VGGISQKIMMREEVIKIKDRGMASLLEKEVA